MNRLFFVFYFVSFSLFAQNIPTDYFRSPLDLDLSLSGNFGELRNNHFHSGLDIRTNYTEGHPIYATADGYISRIGIGHYGYGKALYILHPNGYTTVYGHMQNFAGEIQEYTKKLQYQRESYEIQAYPTASELPVKKGQLIGYSGNTGGSGGPHLHYEIRDGNQRPMNPLLFGIDIHDTRKPEVDKLRIYKLDENAHIDHQDKAKDLRLTKQADGTYIAEKVEALGNIGIGVATFDRANAVENKNGVYQLLLKVNGETHFEVKYDKFSFAETRYINQYIDYAHFKTNKYRVQRLFRETNNPLSVFFQARNNGVVNIKENLSYNLEVELVDFVGNKTKIQIPVQGKERKTPVSIDSPENEKLYIANKTHAITQGDFQILIPNDALYRDTYMDIRAGNDTLYFHNDQVPIHKNISITYDFGDNPPSDINKFFIGRTRGYGKPYHHKTQVKNNKLSINTRDLGTFILVKDTKAPEIKPLNFSDNKWISENKTLRLKIEDDLSGIASYRATINGKFILMEYEYKDKTLTYHFSDKVISDTENNFKLIVLDNVGNSATFEATFYRKEL